MCTGQVCAEHRHLHFSFVAAAARCGHTGVGKPSGIPWKRASRAGRNSRLGLRIVVARDVVLLEQKRNELPVWLGGFLFLQQHFKNLFLQFFSKLLSLSVGEGFECMCWMQKEKFPTACRTILHLFSSFQSRRQSENFTLAESWRNGPFCL